MPELDISTMTGREKTSSVKDRRKAVRPFGYFTATSIAIVAAFFLIAISVFFTIRDIESQIEVAKIQSETALGRVSSNVMVVFRSLETMLEAVAQSVAGSNRIDPLYMINQGTLDKLGINHIILHNGRGTVIDTVGIPIGTATKMLSGTDLTMTVRGDMMRISVKSGSLPWMRRIDFHRRIEHGGNLNETVYLTASMHPDVLETAIRGSSRKDFIYPMHFVLMNLDGSIEISSTLQEDMKHDLKKTLDDAKAPDMEQPETGSGHAFVQNVNDPWSTDNTMPWLLNGMETSKPRHRPSETWVSDVYVSQRYDLRIIQWADYSTLARELGIAKMPFILLIFAASAGIVFGGTRFDRQAVSALFRGIVDNAPSGIVEVGPRGVILFANRMVTDLLGINPVGRQLPDIFHPDNREMLEALMRGGLSLPLTAQMIRYDGVILEMDVTLSSMFQPRHDVDGSYILSLTDVTARQNAIHAEQAAREALEAADREKNQFLAAASHDLRQPVQSIRLFTQRMLRRPNLDDDQREMLTDIEEASGILTRYIVELLDFSRLIAGSVPVDITTVDLAVLIEQIIEDTRKNCSKPIVVSRRILTANPLAMTDEMLMRRVLQNLVSNAVKYTDQGSITVSLTDAETGRLHLEVADTGRGIGPDDQEKIFKEFYQVDNPARDFSHGFGLGLAIVRRSLGLLGHSISVRSELGKGSAFTIDLPVAIPAPFNTERPATREVMTT